MNNWVFWFKHLITITLKTFLKHTRQRQIACFLLLCKQGNLFNTFFREQFSLQKKNNKKNSTKDRSGLLSCCYSYSYKKVTILRRNI